MKTRAIVFDFDGPIFDGRGAARRALARTHEVHPAPAAPHHAFPLARPAQVIAFLYAEAALAPERLAEICAHYSAALEDEESRLDVSDTVRSMLAELRDTGLRLAILSSRREAELRHHLDRLGLADRFDAVAGRDSLGLAKPDPGALVALAAKLKVEPSEIVLVGDSDADFATADGAGAVYYHAAWTGEPCAVAATHPNTVVVPDAAECRTLLTTRDTAGTTARRSLPADLEQALRDGALSFYAGAGVSVPSGLGGWMGHYLPRLVALGGRSLTDGMELPDCLQLLASSPSGAKAVFDAFRKSFTRPDIQPNAYHFAMQRSNAQRIWTSNYDRLFEKAGVIAELDRETIEDDAGLLQHFRDSRLVVKMNGDFESARYADDLDWNLVFLREQFDLAEDARREIWRLFEDDFRNACIVFVGVSFTDPVLRRIVTAATRRIPMTRHTHLLLMREAQHPAEARQFALHAQNLRRQHIETLYFRTHDEIMQFVARVSAHANRPIVGFGGNAGTADGKPAERTARLDGADLTHEETALFCARLGGRLARRGIRVTSGHGPGVGIPAVSAAFAENPMLARFYMRRTGTSAYERTAPAIIVPGDDYRPMRERFLSELGLLVALGGVATAKEPQGTIVEVEMALARHVPVVLVPQAGGHVGAWRQAFLERLDTAYPDDKIRRAVREANETIWALPAARLVEAQDSAVVDVIEDLLVRSYGAAMPMTTRAEPW